MTKELDFLMLYPSEGDSSLLEVSKGDTRDFMYVSKDRDGSLVFEFYAEPGTSLTEAELQEIVEVARRKVSLAQS